MFLNLTALLLMVGFTGCDDDDDTARQAIVGKWVNVTGDEGHVPVDTDFSMEFLSDGTVQPKDVWKMLAESFGLPWTPDAFICSRTGTYRKEAGERKTPFDPGVFDAWVKKK